MVVQEPAGSLHRSGGREVSGYGLRGLLAIMTAALVLITLTNLDGSGFGPVPVVLSVVAGGSIAAFPGSPAATAVSCGVIVLYGTSLPDFGWVAVAVASLLHTSHVLAGLAEIVPARARVELPALVPAFARWWRVQVLAVPTLAILSVLL